MPEDVQAPAGQTVSEAEQSFFDMLESDPSLEEEILGESEEPASEEEEQEESDEALDEDEDDEQPDDEEDSGDDEDEPEEEEETEDEDEELEEDEEPDDFFTVKADGEEYEVNLEELKAGWSRTADYTRKTQELAVERSAVRETQQQLTARLEAITAAAEAALGQEPDWDQVKVDDPDGYATLYADFQRKKAEVGKVQEVRDKEREKQVVEQAEEYKVYLQGQYQKLRAAKPEWTTDDEADSALQKLAVFAKEAYGFSQEELDDTGDHRMLLLLADAQGFREAKSGVEEVIRKKKRRKGTKTLTPGGVTPTPVKRRRSKTRVLRKKKEKLARTGSIHDAASLIFDQLGDDF